MPTALEPETESFGEHVREARSMIERIFSSYAPEHIGISFNGGKDSVVVMELLREVVGLETLRRCCVFFLAVETEFAEMIEFRGRYVAERLPGVKLCIIEDVENLCAGLTEIKRKHQVEAVFIGTRHSDPAGRYQKSAEAPTTEGWPAMLRVCPVFSWSVGEVWYYTLSRQIPFCSLYEKGYTSIGDAGGTVPNQLLKNGDGSYHPAWSLAACDRERDGRL